MMRRSVLSKGRQAWNQRGAGDRVRDLKGKLGEKGAANEEEYFYKKQQQDLENLKKAVEKNIEALEKENEREMEIINKAKKIDNKGKQNK
ncbi:ATPase inhibitor mai-2, mitochondrial-like [Cimex lectularius]|uniref:ATPase inhibitor, mitochondrial n=1 Tax=Cimex lectularius TaxID=79782 RepID=A0A8I6RKZ9_CIMLE|nr:ATPase inhibitor mai-2, mitochondrial-like [Cimex lectularius]